MELLSQLGIDQFSLIIGIGILSVLQWFGLQALVVHYHIYRQNQKKPRPDGIRLNLVERTVAMQTEQTDRIFEKLAALNREIDQLHVQLGRISQRAPTTKEASRGESLETAFVSLGEIALKKRLQEMQDTTKAQ